ncbi:MAG: hypothetical protein U1A27_10090 [Phycisphaerae bacterium]
MHDPWAIQNKKYEAAASEQDQSNQLLRKRGGAIGEKASASSSSHRSTRCGIVVTDYFIHNTYSPSEISFPGVGNQRPQMHRNGVLDRPRQRSSHHTGRADSTRDHPSASLSDVGADTLHGNNQMPGAVREFGAHWMHFLDQITSMIFNTIHLITSQRACACGRST